MVLLYKLKYIFLTVMFSATFPRQMEALARRILNRPIEVQVGGRSVVCKDIEQTVSIVEEEGKFLKLLEVLGSLLGLGSCHFDRSSNDNFSVEFWIVVTG